MIDLIVKVVIAIASVLITGYLLPWLKSKINASKYEELLTLCEKCVEAAEKIYTPEQWQNKKEYVFDMVIDKADSLGIEISQQEINALIEGFVLEVKK